MLLQKCIYSMSATSSGCYCRNLQEMWWYHHIGPKMLFSVWLLHVVSVTMPVVGSQSPGYVILGVVHEEDSRDVRSDPSHQDVSQDQKAHSQSWKHEVASSGTCQYNNIIIIIWAMWWCFIILQFKKKLSVRLWFILKICSFQVCHQRKPTENVWHSSTAGEFYEGHCWKQKGT